MKNFFLKNKILISLSLLAALILFYQNCSEVSLEKIPQVSILSNGVQGSFCTSENNSQTFQFKYFFAYNLTARIDGESLTLLPDTDMDGLSDVRENEQILGYPSNPTNRRTYGRLDGLCEGLSQGACEISNPTLSAIGPGLAVNDLNGFPSNASRGLDSDGDGILDILEILSKSDLALVDDLADLDADTLVNYIEIRTGRNARDNRDRFIPSQMLVSAQAQLVAGSDCGGGNQSYTFVINNMPLVNTGHFTAESFESELSHNSGDNMILVTYTVESGSEKQIYGKYIKINYRNPRGYNLSPSDFVLLGSY